MSVCVNRVQFVILIKIIECEDHRRGRMQKRSKHVYPKMCRVAKAVGLECWLLRSAAHQFSALSATMVWSKKHSGPCAYEHRPALVRNYIVLVWPPTTSKVARQAFCTSHTAPSSSYIHSYRSRHICQTEKNTVPANVRKLISKQSAFVVVTSRKLRSAC